VVASVAPLTAPVEPDEALRRIAFLLERERAGSYRVEAFRKAVVTVRETPPEELRRHHAEGTLQKLPGIGKSTAAVVGEALDGGCGDLLQCDYSFRRLPSRGA